MNPDTGRKVVAWAIHVQQSHAELDTHALAMWLDRLSTVAVRSLVYESNKEAKAAAEARRDVHRAWGDLDTETQLRVCHNVIAYVAEGVKPVRWTA